MISTHPLSATVSANPPPANAPDLESLARARFPDLKPAEVKLVRAATKGDIAVCDPSKGLDDPTNYPAKAKQWGPEREIRAELIRWLCAHRRARKLIDPKGIRVLGAKITGPLDLNSTDVPFPLRVERCCLSEGVTLIGLHVPELSFNGSWTQFIHADGAEVKGCVCLGEGFHAQGIVHLNGATIGGDLDCDGGGICECKCHRNCCGRSNRGR